MIEIKEKINCCGCHACYNICPKDAITMQEDKKGFKYPVIDKEKCINCGLCETVCPIIKNKKIENKPMAYAGYCKDNEIRKQSSSGGIFTLIASNIIKDGGVVYGAIFDKNFDVIHTRVEKIEELEKFRGSKYVQSTIGDTYKVAKRDLEQGKKVLFTGTPCQIEGLKSYLKKEYDNLYTQDIICHGIPSPKVWKKYKEYRKEKDGDTPNQISFRNKDNGWSLFNLKFWYKNGEYKKNQTQDIYMRAFLKDVILRDSCYACSFKKYNRISDITLADFWGINNVMPEMNDNKGTSLIIVNSKKGQELFENVKEESIYKQVDIDQALQYNPSMIKSVSKNPNREKFFENLEKDSFDKLVKKYVPKASIIKRVLSKVKRIVKRMIKK